MFYMQCWLGDQVPCTAENNAVRVNQNNKLLEEQCALIPSKAPYSGVDPDDNSAGS